MKKSKQAYYDKYFERNWNNIKNTWKGIKSLISLKTVASHVPIVLSLDNGDTITNPYDVVITYNYFASVAETMKESIKYSHKHFSDFQIKLVVQYFCNLLIKKKYLLSYPLSTQIWLLAQVVYLAEYYFFLKK